MRAALFGVFVAAVAAIIVSLRVSNPSSSPPIPQSTVSSSVKGPPLTIHFFYINLDSRADRRESMESQFRSLGLKARRWPAVVPPDDVVRMAMKTKKRKETASAIRGIRGAVGLRIANVRLFKAILARPDIYRQHHFVVVMEDDIHIHPDLLKTLPDLLLRKIPSDWDTIRINCWKTWKDFDTGDPYLGGKESVYRTIHPEDRERRRCTKAPSNASLPCEFCGGTHWVTHRVSSLPRMIEHWGTPFSEPWDDIDCELTTDKLNNWCAQTRFLGFEEEMRAKSDITVYYEHKRLREETTKEGEV